MYFYSRFFDLPFLRVCSSPLSCVSINHLLMIMVKIGEKRPKRQAINPDNNQTLYINKHLSIAKRVKINVIRYVKQTLKKIVIEVKSIDRHCSVLGFLDICCI